MHHKTFSFSLSMKKTSSGQISFEFRIIFDYFRQDNKSLTTDEEQFARENFMLFGNKLHKRNGQTLLCVADDVILADKARQLHHQLGHCSAALVKHELQQQFWHPSMTLIAQETIRNCSNYSLRLSQKTIGITLDPITPAQPFARWACDFTGPVHLSTGTRYLLNAIDYGTSWAYSLSCTTPTSHDVLCMISIITTNHGTPLELITDN